MTDRWDTGGSDEVPSDDRTVLIPAPYDTPPPPPPTPPPSKARAALPWVVAGVAVLVALIVGFLALREDDDDERLATSTGADRESTTTTGASSDEGKPGDGDGKGASSPAGDTTPVDKPGNTGTTATTEATTTSTDTTTTTSTSTTTPGPPTTLNFSLPPVYGSTALTSGFVPDPFNVAVSAGGPANASYLGSGCSGHVTSAPSFSVNYTSGAFPTLRFYFVGAGDTTMIVNTPGGSYVCVDDSFGTLNPTTDFNSPSAGRYDIWIGTYAPGATVTGTVYITENTGNHP